MATNTSEEIGLLTEINRKLDLMKLDIDNIKGNQHNMRGVMIGFRNRINAFATALSVDIDAQIKEDLKWKYGDSVLRDINVLGDFK